MTSKRLCNILLCVLLSFHLSAQDVESAVSSFEAGRAAQFEGDYYRAIELYRGALEENPAYLEAIVGMAECYFYLDEYKTSLAWIERARVYTVKDPDILNLEARVNIGLGEIEKAAELFRSVLDIEPNNLGALFGHAELDIVSGNIRNAARTYEDALRISPENSKALLSLVLVYDSLGDTDRAEYYAERSLELHSGSAPAHYITARHYWGKGDIKNAEYHANMALSIDPDNYSAMVLLSDLYLKTGQYERVTELGNRLLGRDRRNSLTWYIMGAAARETGNYEDARYYMNEAVHLQSDDEIARIALEQILIDHFDLEDQYRRKAAAYHFDLGRTLAEKNLSASALREYRRGLMLDPYSEEGRLLYGRVFRDAGNIARYVSVLEVLMNEGSDRRDVKDDYEIYKSLLSGTVAETWGTDQFSLQRDRYSISLFYMNELKNTDHPGSEKVLAVYFRDLLFAYESVEPLEARKVSGFAEAFRTARAQEGDFFIMLHIQEVERIVSVGIEMYNSETGTRVFSTDILRTGNGRIPGALGEATERIYGFLVPRGRLLERSFNRGLIDLGSSDGIREGDVFNIIRRGGLKISTEGQGFDYSENDTLGKFTVTATDYLVSEGTIERKAFFDMVNQYDHVVLANPDGEQPGTDDKPVPLDLYRMLIRIP